MPKQPSTTAWITGIICGAAVAFDGYDIVVYGTTLPFFKKDFGLNPTQAGLIGSAALAGMLIGALLSGRLSQWLGRTKAFAAAMAWFSLLMPSCAATDSPTLFAILRFIAGLGLGAILPLAAALTVEHAPANRKNTVYVAMQSGFPVGGLCAAFVTMFTGSNWHIPFLIAAIPLVTIVPAALLLIPTSAEEPGVRSSGKENSAHASYLADLFAPALRRMTILFAVMSACSLFFVYGCTTWLTSLMMQAGHTAVKSLGFLLSLNAGAIIGGLAAGAIADRLGSKKVVTASFLIGAAGVIGLTNVTSDTALFLLAAVTGYGAIATQTLINSWVTHTAPPHLRTHAVGTSLGVGRLGAIVGPALTGFIIAVTGGGNEAFFAFACFALVGAVLALAVPKPLSSTPA